MAVYAVGAVAIHNAYALDAASSNGASGKGASLSEQTDRLGGQSDRDRADRAKEILAKYPHQTVTTSRSASNDTQNGGSSSYGGDHTGGGGGPK